MTGIKRYVIAAILILGTAPLMAQVEGTQYFMNSLPQVSINNPAFVPQYNFSIGVPALSSIATGYYNSGFSYNDLISKSNGDVVADLPKLERALGAKNFTTVTGHMDFLRVGFRVNPKWYFQVSSTGHQYARAMIPKETVSLFVDGTAPLVGSTTHFSPEAEGLAYLETAVAAAFNATDQLTLGARVKYLNGIANATTVHSSMDVGVGNNYELTAVADLNFKTSGIQDRSQDFQKAASNTGIAIDLGGTYKVTDKLTVAASVVDLGSITWKNNLYSYDLNKNTSSYTFAGLDLKELIKGNSNYLSSQIDSITKKFKPSENAIGSYSTSLPLKMYVSGTYELKKGLNVGGLFFTETFQGRVNPSGTVSVQKYVGKWMNALVSYTVTNRSYNNLGLGISFNVKPVQIYFVGDNLLGAPVSLITTQQINGYLNNARVLNMRFGVNFVWGRDKNLDKLSKNTKPVSKNKKSDPNYLKVRKKSR